DADKAFSNLEADLSRSVWKYSGTSKVNIFNPFIDDHRVHCEIWRTVDYWTLQFKPTNSAVLKIVVDSRRMSSEIWPVVPDDASAEDKAICREHYNRHWRATVGKLMVEELGAEREHTVAGRNNPTRLPVEASYKLTNKDDRRFSWSMTTPNHLK